MESFKELRSYPLIRNTEDEHKFTNLLRSIYRRHANVVPVMAKVCVGSISPQVNNNNKTNGNEK